MKKAIISVFVTFAGMLLFKMNVIAQQTIGSMSFRPEFGVYYGGLTGSNAKIGVVGGLGLDYQITEKIGASASLFYMNLKFAYDDVEYFVVYSPTGGSSSGIQGTVRYIDSNDHGRLNYVGVPLLMNYYIIPNLALKAGIQPTMLVYADRHVMRDDHSMKYDGNITETMNEFEMSIPIGLSYEFSNGLFFDARYNLYITQANRNPDFRPDQDRIYRNGLQVTFGVKLPLKKRR